MNFRDHISRFVARWITASDAASVVATHGAQARKLTAQQRYDDFHARLRAEMAAKAVNQ